MIARGGEGGDSRGTATERAPPTSKHARIPSEPGELAPGVQAGGLPLPGDSAEVIYIEHLYSKVATNFADWDKA